MLRYSKTLSLALLFSLPAIAMENKEVQQGALTKEEALMLAAAIPNPSTDLASTLLVTSAYQEEVERLRQIEQRAQELEKQKDSSREKRQKALEDLLDTKTKKEAARDGAKTMVETLAAQLLTLQQEKEKRAAEIAAEKEKQLTELTAEADKKATLLKQQQENALADQKQYEDALKKIVEIIENAGKPAATAPEAPKPEALKDAATNPAPKTGLFSWLFGSK